MKRILVNMNRSGYFWHELSPVPQPDSSDGVQIAKMKREISADSHPSISALRFYEQYNYVFMKGKDDYILAIHDLNEPRTDGFGRSLKQNVIFEDEDRELLQKLLAYYLTSPQEFEDWVTGECFKPGQNDALCKLVPFNKKIEELKNNYDLHACLKDCEFAISSSQSAGWLQEKLAIKGIDVALHLNKLDQMKGTEFLIPITPALLPPDPPRDPEKDTVIAALKEKVEVLRKDVEDMKKKFPKVGVSEPGDGLQKCEKQVKDFANELKKTKNLVHYILIGGVVILLLLSIKIFS